MTPSNIRPASQAPAIIRLSNGLANRLLHLGLPMGPNVPMTVRGRKSGELRTAPVAVVDIDGRHFVMGAYGEVNWVRNLRAAGEADFRIHGQTIHMTASEMDPAAARTFYSQTLPGYIARFPWFGRAFAKVFFRVIGPELANDPVLAAAKHPVFELTPR